MKKVLVIGAGISGISVAKLLSGSMQVKVLEKSSRPGGLIKCERIDGALFHRVGGHVFNSKNAAVLDWFWKYFDRDTEFIKATRNAKILMNGDLVGYPLENYLYRLPENYIRLIVEELIAIKEISNDTAPDNFEEFLLKSFGKTLYELYFRPYNLKIWNTDLSKVPLEWLEGKLPMPSKKDILINNILRKEEAEMVHSSFYYPKNNGSQFIINRLAEGLDITLSYEVNNIKKNPQGQLVVNNELQADHIIYCGDLRHLHKVVQVEDDSLNMAMQEVIDFTSNGTSNVLCETDDNNLSWLYLPENSFKAHRIIYTGNFSLSNNSPGNRKTCVVEFSGKQNQESMLAELEKLPGNLTALAFNYEPNSYIIQDKQTRMKVAELKKQLEKYNIHLLGRFAEWEYYNMDKCIESAMELSERLDILCSNDV